MVGVSTWSKKIIESLSALNRNWATRAFSRSFDVATSATRRRMSCQREISIFCYVDTETHAIHTEMTTIVMPSSDSFLFGEGLVFGRGVVGSSCQKPRGRGRPRSQRTKGSILPCSGGSVVLRGSRLLLPHFRENNTSLFMSL